MSAANPGPRYPCGVVRQPHRLRRPGSANRRHARLLRRSSTSDPARWTRLGFQPVHHGAQASDAMTQPVVFKIIHTVRRVHGLPSRREATAWPATRSALGAEGIARPGDRIDSERPPPTDGVGVASSGARGDESLLLTISPGRRARRATQPDTPGLARRHRCSRRPVWRGRRAHW